MPPADGVKAAEFDCESYKESCQNLNVTKFPELIYYKDGVEAARFEDEYDLINLRQWTHKIHQTPIVSLNYSDPHSPFFQPSPRSHFLIVTPSPRPSSDVNSTIPIPFQQFAEAKFNSIALFFHLEWPDQTPTLNKELETEQTVYSFLSNTLKVSHELLSDFETACQQFWAKQIDTSPSLIFSVSNQTSFVHPFSDIMLVDKRDHISPSSSNATEQEQTSFNRHRFECPSLPQLEMWFQGHEFPDLCPFSPQFTRMPIGPRKFVLGRFSGRKGEETKQFLDVFTSLRLHYFSDESLIFSTIDSDFWEILPEYLKIPSLCTPNIFVVNFESHLNWTTRHCDSEWTLEKSIDFIESVKNGSLPPSKSRYRPSDARFNPIDIAIESLSIRFDTSKTMIVIFLSPIILAIILIFLCCFWCRTESVQHKNSSTHMDADRDKDI
ncbi:hypothetical protein BLNAU_4078 [Blattamonas nauphoetae]|uniref:Thioredoxin domain-containing protein n=1 Tax=Blattamonas nauphoetae TaxID=2049346 RepID=A0ABQ9YB47_9EUKA|nr:hypothetical protein BLNAU_4078 [Blattamonas nauphoetae]